MSTRSTSGPPSKYEGAVGEYLVSGEYEGKGCRVAVTLVGGKVISRLELDSGFVTLKIETRAGETGPVVLPMAKPQSGNGKAQDTQAVKRDFRLDENGEIETTTIAYLSPAEFDQVTSGAAGPIVPVNSRKEPFGRCIEYEDGHGRLVRTEWFKRRPIRRVA